MAGQIYATDSRQQKNRVVVNNISECTRQDGCWGRAVEFCLRGKKKTSVEQNCVCQKQVEWYGLLCHKNVV